MRTMLLSRRVVVLLAVAAFLTSLGDGAASAGAGRGGMTERERAIHVLNRLAFGPRPGDVERVLAMGVPAYIEEQLEPEKIPDPAATESLKPFATLEMTTAELFD